MTAVYPDSLPPFLQEGYSESPIANKISFAPEIGPSIDRRRGTARTRRNSLVSVMKNEQIAIFENFFEYELKDGVLPFYMPHPRTKQRAKWKFAGQDTPYKITAVSGLRYRVSAELMEIR